MSRDVTRPGRGVPRPGRGRGGRGRGGPVKPAEDLEDAFGLKPLPIKIPKPSSGSTRMVRLPPFITPTVTATTTKGKMMTDLYQAKADYAAKWGIKFEDVGKVFEVPESIIPHGSPHTPHTPPAHGHGPTLSSGSGHGPGASVIASILSSGKSILSSVLGPGGGAHGLSAPEEKKEEKLEEKIEEKKAEEEKKAAEDALAASGSGDGSGGGGGPPPSSAAGPSSGGGPSGGPSGLSSGGGPSGGLGGSPPPPPDPTGSLGIFTSSMVPSSKKKKSSTTIPPKVGSPSKARGSYPKIRSTVRKAPTYSPVKIGDLTVLSRRPSPAKGHGGGGGGDDDGGDGKDSKDSDESEHKFPDINIEPYGVRMLPSLARKLEAKPSAASLEKDFTIKSLEISPHDESSFKRNVLDVQDTDARMAAFRTDIGNMNTNPKIGLQPTEQLNWEAVRNIVSPQLLKEFIDDDTKYNEIMAKIQQDIVNKGLDAKPAYTHKPHMKGHMFTGYSQFNKLWHLANKAQQRTRRTRQLAGLILMYQNLNKSLNPIQQILGKFGPDAPEIKHFTDAETNKIANAEAFYIQTPDHIIDYLTHTKAIKKLNPDQQDALKQMKKNYKEDLVAREHGYLDPADFREKTKIYVDTLKQIADEAKDPEFEKAYFEANEEAKNKHLLDWRFFNEELHFIDKVIAQQPNHALAKKLSKKRDQILTKLKDPKTIVYDLTEAYDEMNGIYKLLSNEVARYNAFANQYSLKPLNSAAEQQQILKHTKYGEEETDVTIPGKLNIEKDIFKDKEKTRKIFKEYQNENFFAFPTIKIYNRNLGIPVVSGVKYLNSGHRKDMDNILDHIYRIPIKFEEAIGTPNKKLGITVKPIGEATTTFDHLIKGDAEILFNSGHRITIPVGGWHKKDIPDITKEFNERTLINLRTALRTAVETASHGMLKVNTRVYPNLSETRRIISSRKEVAEISPKGKKLYKDTTTKAVKAKDIPIMMVTGTGKDRKGSLKKGTAEMRHLYEEKEHGAKEELASDIVDLIDDLREAKDFIGATATAPDLKIKAAKDLAALKVFPTTTGPIRASATHVTKRTARLIPATGLTPKNAPELVIDNKQKSATVRRHLQEQREKKYSEGNFKFAKRITREEPEVNKAYYGSNHIEYDIKNEADLLRMKNEVTKMKGKLYVVDLHTGRLFPIALEHTFINQNYVFIKDLRSETSNIPPKTKKGKGKKNSPLVKGGGFAKAASSAYYPVIHGIFRDEQEQFPNIFMRNGNDKTRQMIHIAAQKPYFNDYRDQIRQDKGAGLWKSVRQSLSAAAKPIGHYIANKTVSAAKDYGRQSVYEGKHFINQQRRNITYIGNANQKLYKNPSISNLNNAVGKTLYGSLKIASQPAITAARQTANTSDFIGKVPGLNVAKAGVSFFVPPVAIADALTHGVKNLDNKNYLDAAINVGDALIGSKKLNGAVELGARVLSTGAKLGDRLYDKNHNSQPPP